MKKNYSKQLLLSLALIASSIMFAQTNRVLVTVDWPSESYKNKVEVYDPANNLLISICNGEECYQSSGSSDVYKATYDLGCLATAPILPDYYIKTFNTDDNDWSGSASVVVNVAGTDVITNDGTGASILGNTISFSVNSATVCNFPDTDGDGVIDFVDQDDDNDGILDTEEGLALNQFNCAVPSLIFENGVYESGGSGPGTLNAVYRFDNALENYDVLLEITELTNTTIVNIDDDSVDTAEFLQSELTFTGSGTPGVTYEFTIVDAGTSTPATTIFRIGGTTWDCDGTDDYQESVRYYNPSAYGLDNPTSLSTDNYVDGAGITAGNVTYGGFSTNTILRSYFQFLNNTFTIRMQLKKTTTTSRTRLYAMSFTQCDIFEYKAPTLTILVGQDTDGDGLDNQMDLDADNDGIPDNIEAQPTMGYVLPNYNGVPYVNIDPITGIDTAYITNPIDIQDTDGDDIPDFLDLDSDNDGTPDILENGTLADSVSAIGDDDDDDGLNDVFETNGINDAILDVNEDIEDPTDLSILSDSDGDLGSLGGDLDYRDAVDFDSATIDFDGVDDYLDSTFDFSGMTQATVMAWIKLDTDFSAAASIIGQGDFYLDVNVSNRISTSVNNGTAWLPAANALQKNKWYHVAVIFDASLPSDNLKLYLNGEFMDSNSHASLLNPMATSTDKFTIGKSDSTDDHYFKGAIDEVRVFDIPLTDDQLQQIVYQEIEEISTLVEGKVVPKNVADFTTTTAIPWANLQAYYPMTNVSNSRTFDYSNYGRNATLHNITSIQPQTAPMPYKTTADGNWNMGSTWLYGGVWDVQDATVKPWAIYHIQHDITVSSSVKSYGLIIDDAKTLTVTGDNEIRNSWYLELNGTIDLANDSQLVQTSTSDLVTDEDGNILRRQEGNLSYFWYNYWSSPVGATAVTNNTNTDFAINMLKDGSGNAMTFTSAYNETGKISNRWLYKFQNGQTYYDWVALAPNSTIEPGVGYTQKGTNSAVGDQQYIFEGKPNNGTILLNADDIDGDSANEHSNSTGMFNYTSTLIGNPYPSALDAEKFIADNPTVISGAIYVWEQWAGTSHNLHEYEGGYGTINMGSVAPAYQWNDSGLDVSAFVKTPTPYIPVGQGFFVEVVADSGTIEFNNDQRVFKSEDLGESIFFRNSNSENATSTSSEDNPLGLMRLELTVSNGNKRNFVLLFGESATDDFDYGYDARTIDPQQDDLNSFLNDEKMVIQSFAPITNDKVVDLVFNSTGTYNYTIEMIDIENIPEDQEVYLRDNLTNTYFNLRSGAYSFSSEVNAEDTERFDIVFQPGETLGTEEFENDDTVIFVNNTEDMLYVKGLASQAKQLNITNMLGQNIRSYNGMDNQTLENGLNISGLSSGVYLVNVRTENNLTIDKKIIVD